MGPKTIRDFRRDHPIFFERGKKKFHGDQSYHVYKGHLIIKKKNERPYYGGVSIYMETPSGLHHLDGGNLEPEIHDTTLVSVARDIIDSALSGNLKEWYANNYPDYEGSRVYFQKHPITESEE